MGTKTYNNYEDLLTFTRASKGHALRPVSYGTELVTNGDFATDSVWTKQTGWTISGGSASCDGSSATNSYIQQEISGVRRDGTVYLIEFDVTARTGGGNVLVFFGSGSSSSISDANTTGRKSVVRLLEGTNDRLYIGCPSGNTMTIDNVSVKEVTFDQPDGTLTLFEHPVNVPRVEWDSAGNRLGLLVEEARTNQILYSEDFSNSYWNKTQCTVSQAPVAAPDGTMTATHVVKTGSDGHLVRVDSFSASASGTIWIRSVSGTGTVHTSFHPISLVTVTEEWQRLPAVVLSANGNFYAVNFRGDATLTEVYIWGAQLEAGSFPTSYIKTTGATATRSADVASIPVADFGYNQSEGTLFVEANAPDGSNQNRLSQLVTSGGATNRVVDLHRVTNDIVMYNGTTTMTGDVFAASNDIKAAGAYKSGDYALVSDGGSATTASDSTVYTPDTLTIGMNGASSRQLNGHIKSIKYYPRRLSNAQLVELTS